MQTRFELRSRLHTSAGRVLHLTRQSPTTSTLFRMHPTTVARIITAVIAAIDMLARSYCTSRLHDNTLLHAPSLWLVSCVRRRGGLIGNMADRLRYEFQSATTLRICTLMQGLQGYCEAALAWSEGGQCTRCPTTWRVLLQDGRACIGVCDHDSIVYAG